MPVLMNLPGGDPFGNPPMHGSSLLNKSRILLQWAGRLVNIIIRQRPKGRNCTAVPEIRRHALHVHEVTAGLGHACARSLIDL
jgi:hypothetical protein